MLITSKIQNILCKRVINLSEGIITKISAVVNGKMAESCLNFGGWNGKIGVQAEGKGLVVDGITEDADRLDGGPARSESEADGQAG